MQVFPWSVKPVLHVQREARRGRRPPPVRDIPALLEVVGVGVAKALAVALVVALGAESPRPRSCPIALSSISTPPRK